MIAKWDVLQYVAGRYGKVTPVFDQARKKLELVRENKIPLSSLEDNLDRVAWRMAREENPVRVAVERINGYANFQDVWILSRLAEMSHAVCRILRRGQPHGTGFLVGEGVIMTNHHVIGSPEEAADMEAEFNYEYGNASELRPSVRFPLDADRFFLTSALEQDDAIPFSGLDFTLVGVGPGKDKGTPLSSFPILTLDGNKGKIIKGESCIVIQHPNGMPKKVVIRDTAFFSETETRLVYESDTLPGASGSVVIGLGTGEVIALHHAGLPRTDAQNNVLTKGGAVALPGTPDEEIDWIGNEGIKISCIVAALQAAELPHEMQAVRQGLLRQTVVKAQELKAKTTQPPAPGFGTSEIPPGVPAVAGHEAAIPGYLLMADNTPAAIAKLEAALRARYGPGVLLQKAAPRSVSDGQTELFTLQLPKVSDAEKELRSLLSLPGVSYAGCR